MPMKSPTGHQTVSSPSKTIRTMVVRMAAPSPSTLSSRARTAPGPGGRSIETSRPGSIRQTPPPGEDDHLPSAGSGWISVWQTLATVAPRALKSSIVKVFTAVPAGYVRYSMLYQRPGGGAFGLPGLASSYVILQCRAYGTGRYRLPAAPAFSMANGLGTKDLPARRSYSGASMAGSWAPSR